MKFKIGDIVWCYDKDYPDWYRKRLEILSLSRRKYNFKVLDHINDYFAKDSYQADELLPEYFCLFKINAHFN